MKKYILGLLLVLVIGLFTGNVMAESLNSQEVCNSESNVVSENNDDESFGEMGVEYRAHIENIGNYPADDSWISGPDLIGSEISDQRIEGLQLQLTGDIPEGAKIVYNLQIQDLGWLYDSQDPTTWQIGPDYAGTIDESKQIEAIQIELLNADGEKLEDYSVGYYGYIQDQGQQVEVLDGEVLGTTGQSLMLEALSVEIIKTAADLTAYESALANVNQADYTEASWLEYQVVVAKNIMADTNIQEEVDVATENILAAQQNLVLIPDSVAIVSLSAIGASTLEVVFNQAVDTENADFSIIKGATTGVDIDSITWSDDKMSIQLITSSWLTASTYTVSVTGLEEETLTSSVITEAETVASIEITSDLCALQDDACSVSVGYAIYNQYGEDISSRISVNSSVISAYASGNAEVTLDKENATATISRPDKEYEVGDVVTLTLIYEKEDLVTSKKLTVSDEAGVAQISFGDVYNEDGLSLTMDNTGEPFYLIVEATDQYGNELDADFLNNSDHVRVICTDESVVELEEYDTQKFEDLDLDNDGEDETTALKFTIVQDGDCKLSIISLLDGTKATSELTIATSVQIDLIDLYQPDDLATAGEKVTIPFEAIDTDGNVVSDFIDLSEGVTFSVSLGGGLEDDPDSPAKASFKRSASSGTVSLILDLSNVIVEDQDGGTVSLTAKTETGNSVKINIKIYQEAVLTAISGPASDLSLSPAIGGTSEIDCDSLEYIDQYDQSVDFDSDYDIEIEVGNTDIATLEASTDGGKTAYITDEETIILTGVTNGTTTITFTLYKDGKIVSGSEYSDEVTVAAAGEYESYAINSLNPVYDSSQSDYKTSSYTRTVFAYGYLSDGTEVTLTSDDYSVLFEGYDGLSAVAKSGVWKLLVDQDADIDYPEGETEVTGKVTVIINATGETFETEVTISKALPAMSTVAFSSGTGKVSGGGYTLTQGSIDADTVIGLLSTSSSKDTYHKTVSKFSTAGVTFLDGSQEAISVTFSEIENRDDDDPMVIENNGTNEACISNAKTGDAFTVTISFAGGASGSFNVYTDISATTALEAINDSTSISKTGTVLKLYATGLGIDLTDYNTLGTDGKTSVNTIVYNNGKNYGDIESVQNVFDIAVSKQKAAEES